MSGEYLDSEFYTESSYTADISNKMRVPDRYTIINFYFMGFDITVKEKKSKVVNLAELSLHYRNRKLPKPI